VIPSATCCKHATNSIQSTNFEVFTNGVKELVASSAFSLATSVLVSSVRLLNNFTTIAENSSLSFNSVDTVSALKNHACNLNRELDPIGIMLVEKHDIGIV
jgi:hypothetical protein